jgi:hypothetical protein
MEMNETIEIFNELNSTELSKDSTQITNENYSSTMNNLENIFKTFECNEIFKMFKTYQSLILDENLKIFNLNNFYNLFKPNKSPSFKAQLIKHLEYISAIVQPDKIKTDSHFMDIFFTTEINYLAIYAFFKLSNFKYSFTNNSNFSSSLSENSMMNDLLSLSNLNHSYTNFFEFFINFVHSTNLKVRSREYFLIFMQIDKKCPEFSKNKIIFSNLEIVLNPIFLSLKSILSPSKTILEHDLKIKIDHLKEITNTLFKVIFDYMMIYYKSYEITILNKISNFPAFEFFSMFQNIITNYICEIKFKEKENFIDYHTFFPNFSDWFWIDYMSVYKQKIVTRMEELLFILSNLERYDLNKLDLFYTPPYLLNASNESFKDFIVHHFIASYINDNNYEVVSRNIWLKTTIECYAYSNFLEIFYKSIITNIQKRNSSAFLLYDSTKVLTEIVEHFDNLFETTNLLLPKKFMLLKDIYCLSNLLIFHHFITIFPSFKVSDSMIKNLQKLSLYQNKYYFIICNDILSKKNTNVGSKFRLCAHHTHPINFQDVISISAKKISDDKCDNFSNRNSKWNEENHKFNYDNNINDDDIIVDLDNQMITDTNNENMNVMNVTMNNIVMPQENKIRTRSKSKTKKGISSFSITSSGTHLRPRAKYNRNIHIYSNKSKKGSKTKLKKPYESSFSAKFDVTQYFGHLEDEQIKMFQVKYEKKVKLTKIKNGKFLLKVAGNLTPMVLIIKDNNLDLFFNHLNSLNLKEKLLNNFEIINRADLEYLMIMNLDAHNQNIIEQSENAENLIKNFKNIFTHYDIEEKLDYYSVIENLLKLFEPLN